MHAKFSGPIPPPDLLKQYDEVCPGFAERLMLQFEGETQHRHDIDNKMLDAQIKTMRSEVGAFRTGQLFAFVIAIAGLFASAYCVSQAQTTGQAWAGASIAGLSLATLIGVFLYGHKVKSKEGKTAAKE